MKKLKIAISIGKNLLDLVDSRVDGSTIRSRSQSVEYFLEKGMIEFSIDTALILLSKRHHQVSLKEFKGQSLIRHQLSFFAHSNILNVFLVTQHSPLIEKIGSEANQIGINFRVIEKEAKGNAQALKAAADKVKDKNFVVISGDIYNNFSLKQMIKKHNENDKLITMGLMTRDKPSEYGSAILDGDLVIDFREKSDKKETHVVNAGVYIFKSSVFEYLDENIVSLERDLFPKIARIKQLVGFFTHGDYMHFGE